MQYEPIIIIGAPRSGTNILRDTIVKFDQAGTWNCDELPYLWKYGNRDFKSDILTKDMLSGKSKKYIRNFFKNYSEKNKVKYVVEKTCANSLRVGYIAEIFPEAKFIYIVRDGLDVVSSAVEKFTSKFSLSYTMKKFRYVPSVDIPFYLNEFLKNQIHKKLNNGHPKYWGPRFTNNEVFAKYSLEEIAAHQWSECINKADEGFKAIDDNNKVYIKYEEFVSNPQTIISKIQDKLTLPDSKIIKLSEVKSNSIGKGRIRLSESQINKILPIINNSMVAHGYPV